jgi:hypothetical protein
MTGYVDSYTQLQYVMGDEGHFQKLHISSRRNGGERRGVQDWLNDEQREDRRSGLIRRSSADNREDERRVIPFAIAPRGSLRAADGSQWGITLWDISRTGFCVIANGQVDLPVATSCELILSEVIGTGMVNFQALLMWLADDAFHTYLGMKFELPPELPPDTYLERYIKANFDV